MEVGGMAFLSRGLAAKAGGKAGQRQMETEGLRPLTIVQTAGSSYGVVLGRTDSPYEEYRVQLIEVEGDELKGGGE